jgi:tetratricopeptide (TPR) repeat protein
MGRDSDIQWRSMRTESPWLIGFGVVLAASGALLNNWHGPSWALLVLGLLIAAGGVLWEWRKRAASRTDARAAIVDTSSRSLRPTGKFQTVTETPPEDFRFHRGDADLPYLRRDRHQELLDRLVEGKPVLLVGHSLAGKTRMAYEVIREQYGHWPVWIPERPDGLATLLPAATPDQVVVWLDDLESYLTANEQLRLPWLDALDSKGCRVVATIRASEYEKFQPVEEVRTPQWEVLEKFAIVHLEDDQDEQNRLATEAPDERIADGIRHYGLGEYLGGGYIALDRFKFGKETHPFGVAMIQAAADWRRLGFEQISESSLRELAPLYLSERFRNISDLKVEADLAWVTEQLGGRVRLLEPMVDGLRVFDYLLDILASEGAGIPQALWQTAIAAAGDIEQTLDLGRRAYGEDEFEWAAHAWQLVIDSGSVAAPEAAVNLGLLRENQDDLDAAAEAYQIAIDSGDRDEAPKAAVHLGLVREDQGDLDAAARAYQLALDSHHPDQAPLAAVDLGMLRRSQGDFDAAQAYQLALESSHPDKVPVAALELGDVRAEHGEPAVAAQAYRLAIDFGPNDASMTAKALARLRSLQDP